VLFFFSCSYLFPFTFCHHVRKTKKEDKKTRKKNENENEHEKGNEKKRKTTKMKKETKKKRKKKREKLLLTLLTISKVHFEGKGGKIAKTEKDGKTTKRV
jgi:uncharacterized ion transporter superfamily protein YfcC